jgi:hypothetical protein
MRPHQANDAECDYRPSFELEYILVSRDNMALAIHNQGTGGDLVLDEHLATVCTITDVASVRYFSTQP